MSEAARETFYRIYTHRDGDRSDLVNKVLEQLDFRPLPITLLATLARHKDWDANWMAQQWYWCHKPALLADHNKTLAAIVELSLSSSLVFRDFGPEARDILGIVAFFPQGIDEKKLGWLFPRVHPRKREGTFERFLTLSLLYRSDGFITMEAPLRRYFYPKDPLNAPHLEVIRNDYFGLLFVNDAGPGEPGFEEAKWIISEDVNVEHLVDVFTGVDADRAWRACGDFMRHLFHHKPRLVALGPRVEALPDDHPYKPECLFQLSRLSGKVGNQMESKRLLTRALELSGGQGETTSSFRH